MATTLPVLTQTIDDAFVSTWYDIKPEAIDNILKATVVWNALFGAGCGTEQVGGEFITRTLAYGEQTAQGVIKGDLLGQGEPALDTMAIWEWKYISTHVQRSIQDDQKNNGPSKIKDYVGRRLTAARDALEQKYETDVLSAFHSNETGKTIQSLHDMIPPYANKSSGTYGRIARPLTYAAEANGVEVPATGNTWWGPKYFLGTLVNIAVDLLTDMKKLYNSCHANQSAPNLLLTTQTIFEIYEEFAIDISQIIKDETSRLADLGFEVLRFKGKPLIWSTNQTAGVMMMVNTDWVEIVYDPMLWFDMTEFKAIPLQGERIAHILSCCNLISTQLRRHGRLQYA